ncbi:MAG: hypothetical protein ABW046_13140 [Actinoplanes sp.]
MADVVQTFRPEDQVVTQSWARGEAIQPMTTEVLVRRSLEFSASGFITIISIIQGVTLGLLAQQTFEKRTLLVGFHSVAMLMVLVAVFYFYMTLSILLRWAPSFLDAFLPFAIGALEIPPAFFLGKPMAWSAWLAAFWLFTSAGVLLTIKWTPPSHFGGDLVAHRLMHRLLWEVQITAAIGGILSGAVAAATVLMPGSSLPAVLGVLVVLATVAGVVAAVEKNAARIHRHYGVNRPAFN